MDESTNQVELHQATQEQYQHSISRHAPQWGSSLSLLQYVEREELLSSRPATVNGKFICWVLVPHSDPKTLDFFCSCETLERTVMMTLPDKSTPRKEVFPSYSICSVYSDPRYRKQGYASVMMKLLHQKLSHPKWLAELYPDIVPGGSNKAVLSVLYSDIGPEFYARAGPPGWLPCPSLETSWPVNGSNPSFSQLVPDPSPSLDLDLDPIQEEHFREIAEIDRRRLWEEDLKEGEFAIVPTGDELDWLISRSKYYARLEKAQGVNTKLPSTWGCRLRQALNGHGAQDGQFVLWTIDYPARTLWLLRVRVDHKETSTFFEAALRMARGIAGDHGCLKIKAWNLDPRLAAVLGGVTAPRQDSLSAVAMYDELASSGTTPSKNHSLELKWVADEKMFWC